MLTKMMNFVNEWILINYHYIDNSTGNRKNSRQNKLTMKFVWKGHRVTIGNRLCKENCRFKFYATIDLKWVVGTEDLKFLLFSIRLLAKLNLLSYVVFCTWKNLEFFFARKYKYKIELNDTKWWGGRENENRW